MVPRLVLTTYLLLTFQDILFSHAFSTSQFLSRASNGWNRLSRRGETLVRDLRVSYLQLLGSKEDLDLDSSQQVFCVRPDELPVVLSGDTSSTSPATATVRTNLNSASTGSPSSTTLPTASATSQYKLVESHSGESFFDGWTFFGAVDDATGGIVNYLDQQDAESSGLVNSSNSAGRTIIKVDTTSQISGNRNSIRITTKNTFTQGVFVLDAYHMPQGCATWPAFWTNGVTSDWPSNGEIDIVEGINDNTNNQATLHTLAGCTLSSDITTSSTLSGTTDCSGNDNAGCGYISNSSSTFGSGFNSIEGGVYAMVWDNDSISVYFFPRGNIPADITNEAPTPDSWSTPMARWSSKTCDISNIFKNHWIIINTTLCGQWAGNAWNSSGAPGQAASCATRTGYSNCEDYVRNSGASFSDAYWEIASVKVYQISRAS